MATLDRVRTIFTGVAGTPWYSNMYFDGSGTNEVAHVDMVRDFWTAIAGQINTLVTGTVQGDVAKVDSVTGNITGIVGVTPEVVDFTGAGDVLSPALQTCLNLLTGVFVAGRQLRGKVFVPGLTEAINSPDGTPASGFLDAQVAAMEALITASNTAGNLQVWSPTHGVAHDVVNVSAKTTFAVMRSRRD